MTNVTEIQGSEELLFDVLNERVLPAIDAKRKENAMSAPAIIEPQATSIAAPRSTAITPMEMLNQAVASGASIDTLTKLMDLQERWEANQARKAFEAALSKAKAEITPIVRNATGHNQKRYADFAAIARSVDPILAKYGLSYRFKTKQEDRITVTCVLSHEEGHSEETTLSGPSDTSGNKNAIQAIGSTLSYLQRYSLNAALGLASANDDDGAASGKTIDDSPISEEQYQKLRDLIDETGAKIDVCCELWRVEALQDLPASKFEGCCNALRSWAAKQNKRSA